MGQEETKIVEKAGAIVRWMMLLPQKSDEALMSFTDFN